MTGPSKLSKALLLLFLVSLLALFAQLLFLLYRRRSLRRLNPSQPDPNESTTAKHHFLDMLFCIKSKTRVEPTGSGEISGSDEVDDPNEGIDVFKLRDMMYGPSRVLFTIKEEEKEDLESEKSLPNSASKKTCSRNLSQCLDDTSSLPEFAVGIDQEEEEFEASPFSTPCASPLYYTPSASPLHGVVML